MVSCRPRVRTGVGVEEEGSRAEDEHQVAWGKPDAGQRDARPASYMAQRPRSQLRMPLDACIDCCRAPAQGSARALKSDRMCGFMRRAPIPIQLVLVPYDTARRHWGMGSGPAHLVNHGLVEELEAAGHSVDVSIVDAAGDEMAEVRTAFALMTGISTIVRGARDAGRFPLVLAGNCNTAVGTVAGLDYADSIGVFWFDAHGDFNTPDTTLTGVLDGMALAMLTGRCWRGPCRGVSGY